jgi:23S rRNA (cytosine1962-C5)-methyltransferase
MPQRRSASPRRKTRSSRYSSGTGRLPRQLPLAIERTANLATVTLAKPTSHPNIFRKRIVEHEGSPKIGDWIGVYAYPHANDRNESQESHPTLLGYGIYNPKSEVAVRMVRWSEEVPDARFWEGLVDRATSLRRELLDLDSTTNCYRLIHAEADGFPGLVVDRFGDCLSAEVFSAAMAPRVNAVIEMAMAATGCDHWLVQPGPHLQSQEGFEFSPYSSPNLPEEVQVHENDVRFTVQFRDSHKTGFFCDQRENRQRLSRWSDGKRVLDLCCYTGGFAVTAAKGGAQEVTGVDLDKAPLEVAKRNARINGVQAKFTQADAFSYMRDMLRQSRSYDVVVLDPPKLIRNRSEIDEGTRRHFDLNRLAMQLVRPGGLMLTCSCAGLLQTSDFTRLVRAAARSAFQPSEWDPHPTPRNMQILSQQGAAACHPVSANCPETEYFKSMWIRL